MKPGNALLAHTGTTIFTVMSALAAEHDAINLGQGFPDTDGPPDVLDAAAAALFDNRNQYAPLAGLPELRQAVSAANQRFYNLPIPPAQIVVTSGATEAITACLMALLNPGDEVVLLEPLYDTYLPMVKMLGAVPKLVRLLPPAWSLSTAELAAAFSARTKAILLNTPQNPTGKVFSAAELATIAALLQRHDAYAICDEVYEHLVFTGATHIPLMTLPGIADRCLRIGSAGKTFSFTGWKIGYVSGPAPLIDLVAKAHQNLTFATAPNLQRAIAIGLAKDKNYFHTLAADLQARRDILAAGLAGLGFDVLPTSGSYFLIAGYSRFSTLPDTEYAIHLTRHAGVATIPLSAFYASTPPDHFVRFAFCKRPEVLRGAVGRLGEARPGALPLDPGKGGAFAIHP